MVLRLRIKVITLSFLFLKISSTAKKIFSTQPWSFDKFLVAFQRYNNNIHVCDLDFERVPFWVQVYDIPISFMNKKVAEGLCSGIGEVCSSDFSVMEGGDHVRVRVILDVTKPLCRGRKISLDGGSSGWVSFKYERLPSLCFWCGCLTYGKRDCEVWIASGRSLTVEDRKYGTWLRAPLSNKIRKSTIVVPGFYQQKKLLVLLQMRRGNRFQILLSLRRWRIKPR